MLEEILPWLLAGTPVAALVTSILLIKKAPTEKRVALSGVATAEKQVENDMTKYLNEFGLSLLEQSRAEMDRQNKRQAEQSVRFEARLGLAEARAADAEARAVAAEEKAAAAEQRAHEDREQLRRSMAHAEALHDWIESDMEEPRPVRPAWLRRLTERNM